MVEILVKLCRRMPEFKSDPNFVITPAIWRESEKILKRCYKMLEITEYERTAWVRKALAEAKPDVANLSVAWATPARSAERPPLQGRLSRSTSRAG